MILLHLVKAFFTGLCRVLKIYRMGSPTNLGDAIAMIFWIPVFTIMLMAFVAGLITLCLGQFVTAACLLVPTIAVLIWAGWNE